MRVTSNRGVISCALATVVASAVLIASQPQSPARPKLMVLTVIDQVRFDYLAHYRDQLTAGLKRLTADGAVFTEAYYPYASTETAQGHSTMVTGQSPSVSGIVGDTWYDRQTKTNVTAALSADHALIGGAAGGGSPEQLLVHALGDVMKEQDRRGLVQTVSWKRYSAVLMGGLHGDAAYWFDPTTGHMVTSDYYLTKYPSWVERFNAADFTRPFFGRQWLNHKLGGTEKEPNAAFRTAFRATPYANDLVLKFVNAMLTETELGRDDVPDLLGVSLSATDYVGHEYGPETPEFDDVFLNVDRQLGELMDALDKRVGRGQWLLALVADHGAAFLPEKMRERGQAAGRLDSKAFRAAVVEELSRRWPDAGELIEAWESPEFYVNYGEGARRGIDVPTLERAVADAARKQAGVAQVYTRSEILAAGPSSDPILRAVANGFYPARSGDVYVVLQPNFIFWGAAGTTHGAPYEYDQHVPLIFYGRGVRKGTYSERVLMNDLAPTLAAAAGVEMRGLPGHALTTAVPSTPARTERAPGAPAGVVKGQ